MTQTAGRVSLELANDPVGGEDGRSRNCDVYPIGEDANILQFDVERDRSLADELPQALSRRAYETGLVPHGFPHEVVDDSLIQAAKILYADAIQLQNYIQSTAKSSSLNIEI